MSQKVSDEIDALLRFYSKRKLISVKDIREFSETYKTVAGYMARSQDDGR